MNAKTKEIKYSRIGKMPVTVPAGVDIKINGRDVSVKGPKGGPLNWTMPETVEVVQEGSELLVKIASGDRSVRSAHGLTRSLLENMVVGVSKGYERKLSVTGVGYRADMKGGRFILFYLGYSHPILFELPEGVSCEIAKDNTITLRGVDKQVLGQTAAKIRGLRPPEPYKGKGIRYSDEVIRRKAGKAAGR